MSTIITRSGKGSPLFNNEIDANFDNLNTTKVEKDGSTAFTGKQTFSAGLSLVGDIDLVNAATLLLGDATNTITIAGTLNATASAATLAASATLLANTKNFSIDGDGTAAGTGFNGSGPVVLSLTNVQATSLKTSRDFTITGDGTADAVGFDGSGNLALSLTDIAATTLKTPRGFTLAGAITAASVDFDGSAALELTTVLADDTVTPAKIDNGTPADVFTFPNINVGGGSDIEKISIFSADVDVPIIAANTSVTVTVAVTGTTFSSFVIAQPSADFTSAGLSFTSFVSSVGNVDMIFSNHAGGSSVANDAHSFNFLIINN